MPIRSMLSRAVIGRVHAWQVARATEVHKAIPAAREARESPIGWLAEGTERGGTCDAGQDVVRPFGDPIVVVFAPGLPSCRWNRQDRTGNDRHSNGFEVF